MQPSFVMFSMIMVFACMLLLIVLSGPVAALIKFAVKSLIGAGIIYLCDMFLSPFGIYVGVNAFTACIVGFLGLPGLGSLMLISHILGI